VLASKRATGSEVWCEKERRGRHFVRQRLTYNDPRGVATAVATERGITTKAILMIMGFLADVASNAVFEHVRGMAGSCAC
jgi:hypothetical protein